MLLLNFRQEHEISDAIDSCVFTVHPSLIALSGASDKIELFDISSSFSGLSIFDQNVPFNYVNDIIPHKNDANLFAISCKTENFNPNFNCDSSLSELRIYDLRYPKESTMRISTEIPITKFISFDSNIKENFGTFIYLC